jgi:hypothetical protein
MAIDPETRDVVRNIYLQGREGEWRARNIELATVENVKDPVKAARNS